MPSRYFPTSQDINSDPEVWELTDEFGDRSIRIWLEVLAICDREKNRWRLVNGWESVIGRKVRQSPATVSRAVGWMLAKGWLEVGELLANGQPAVVRLHNYAKFRKIAAEASPPPNLPNLPNLPNKIVSAEPEKNSGSTPTKKKALKPWPEEDLWLKALIDKQQFLNNSNGSLHDFEWWENLSVALSGIEQPFMERELAKMSNWLKENPTRRPTAKGTRRFVRTWLEKAKEQGNRLYAIKR